MTNLLEQLDEALKSATLKNWEAHPDIVNSNFYGWYVLERDQWVEDDDDDINGGYWEHIEISTELPEQRAKYIALCNPSNVAKMLRVLRLAEQVDKFIVKPRPPGNAFAIRSELTEALEDLK